jgi:hypothetical protein
MLGPIISKKEKLLGKNCYRKRMERRWVSLTRQLEEWPFTNREPIGWEK